MRIIIVIMLLLPIFGYGSEGVEKYITYVESLDEASDWITKNINLPQDAHKFHVAATERLCISVAWDGRVFITNRLTTLNPAFEDEIVRVVSHAPKVILTASTNNDIYKEVFINFAELIHPDSASQFTLYPQYIDPTPPISGATFLNGRDMFAEQIHSHIKLHRDNREYCDTVTFRYTIAPSGYMHNFIVEKCDKDQLRTAIMKAAKRYEEWKPAITQHKEPISITIREHLVVNKTPSGRIKPFVAYRDDVMKNSDSAPSDSNIIVLNPQVKAKIKAAYALNKTIIDGVGEVASPKRVSGSIIVNTLGDVESINFDFASNAEIANAAANVIGETKWTPAMQGNKPVRTILCFNTNIKPNYVHGSDSNDENVFGKHYVFITQSIVKSNYRYIQNSSGIEYTNAFSSSGEYNQGVALRFAIEKAKIEGVKSPNASQIYFKAIKKSFK